MLSPKNVGLDDSGYLDILDLVLFTRQEEWSFLCEIFCKFILFGLTLLGASCIQSPLASICEHGVVDVLGNESSRQYHHQKNIA